MRTTPVAIALGLLLLAGNLPAQVAVPRTVQVGGVRLEFLEWGKSGRTLILVPGSCDTAFIFGDLAPRLAHQFRVLSFTPRGCPGSGTATDGYGIDAQLRELVGFLDSHGINVRGLTDPDPVRQVIGHHRDQPRAYLSPFLEAAGDFGRKKMRVNNGIRVLRSDHRLKLMRGK